MYSRNIYPYVCERVVKHSKLNYYINSTGLLHYHHIIFNNILNNDSNHFDFCYHSSPQVSLVTGLHLLLPHSATRVPRHSIVTAPKSLPMATPFLRCKDSLCCLCPCSGKVNAHSYGHPLNIHWSTQSPFSGPLNILHWAWQFLQSHGRNRHLHIRSSKECCYAGRVWWSWRYDGWTVSDYCTKINAVVTFYAYQP